MGGGGTYGRKDSRTEGQMSGNSPCVLQDIGPLGPLPKKEEKEKEEKIHHKCESMGDRRCRKAAAPKRTMSSYLVEHRGTFVCSFFQ